MAWKSARGLRAWSALAFDRASLPHRRGAGRTFVAATLACGALSVGCQEQRPQYDYTVVTGTVAKLHPLTGEMFVQPRQPRERDPDAPVFCVFTRHTEVYVNDQFSTVDDIEPGDTVELVGYRDPNPRLESFIVTFANVDHALPPPPVPALEPTDAKQPD